MYEKLTKYIKKLKSDKVGELAQKMLMENLLKVYHFTIILN